MVLNEVPEADTTPPTATITLTDDSLTIGETTEVTILFSEKVTGLELADFTVENGKLSNLSSSDNGKTWTATLMPDSGIDNVASTIKLGNTYFDLADNQGTEATQSFNIDTKAPTLIISSEKENVNLGNGQTDTITFKFSEAVEWFVEDSEKATTQGGELSNFEQDSSDPTIWTATFTRNTSDPAVAPLITVKGDTYKDLLGNTGGDSNVKTAKGCLTILNYQDNYGDVKDTFPSGTTTDDNTPTFNGTAIPGEIVYVYQYNPDGLLQLIDSAQVDTEGKWSLTPEYLTNRTHEIFVSYEASLAEQDPTSVQLPPPFEFTIQGITSDPEPFGERKKVWGTSTAGDINGDGFDDLVALSYIDNGDGDVILGGPVNDELKLSDITFDPCCQIRTPKLGRF